jgi:hypothetical protein
LWHDRFIRDRARQSGARHRLKQRNRVSRFDYEQRRWASQHEQEEFHTIHRKLPANCMLSL